MCRAVRDLLSLGVRNGNGSRSLIGLAAVRVHSLAVEIDADEQVLLAVHSELEVVGFSIVVNDGVSGGHPAST
jgi:hypothetical protein